MTAFAAWYLVVQAVGALALALTWRFWQVLPDRGYCLSKSLGILLVGTVLWWGTSYEWLRNEPGGAWLAILLLGLLALFTARRWLGPGFTDLLSELRSQRRLILVAEALFLGAFAGWCLVRSFDPAADHTEEPMDLMFLSSVTTSPTFPPRDAWLSGYPISYYYLGYWLLGTLAHLSGLRPEIAYNVGQGCWFGLLLLGCFGLGYNVLALARTASTPASSPRRALLGGGLAAVTVGLSSNLHLPLEWIGRLRQGRPAPWTEEGWWWWRSSRVVKDTDLAGETVEIITEFPVFSYVLGDNHPHVLAMPFVLLVLGFALCVLLTPERAASVGFTPRPEPVRSLLDSYGGSWGLALAVLLVGALIPLNTWDYPLGLAVVVLAGCLGRSWFARAGLWRRIASLLTPLALLIGGTALLFFPYFLTAQSQVEGILPNLFHPTPARHVLVMFGSLVPGIVLLLLEAAIERRPPLSRVVGIFMLVLGAGCLWLLAGAFWTSASGAGQAWLASLEHSGIDPPLGVALGRWLRSWPVFVVGSGALALTLALLPGQVGAAGRESRGIAVAFTLLLAALGLALVIAPELAYLRDGFGTRMNSVFKLYYQGWLLLGMSSAVGMVWGWSRGPVTRAASILGCALLATGLLWAPMAIWAKTRGFGSPHPSLDALAWLQELAPEELEAVAWVRANTGPSEVIAQLDGDSYRAEHDLLSAATGRATLLGWVGHELQWRGRSYHVMTAGRLEALRRIYNPGSSEDLAAVLRDFRVDLVRVGPQERARYSMTAEHEATMGAALDLAFESGAVRLYRRRD